VFIFKPIVVSAVSSPLYLPGDCMALHWQVKGLREYIKSRKLGLAGGLAAVM
jgi:hypothetical protein